MGGPVRIKKTLEPLFASVERGEMNGETAQPGFCYSFLVSRVMAAGRAGLGGMARATCGKLLKPIHCDVPRFPHAPHHVWLPVAGDGATSSGTG
jgi:hypothetical protein